MKNTVILICILLLGLSLRITNLDFPSIGYHNMKENESLSVAQEMQRTQDFLKKRVYFLNAFEKDTAVKDNPQPPLVSYQILLAWKIFGENLWAPRLFNVIFGLGSIVLMYFIGRLLFGNVVLAFFSAFLLAVMPLAVFFSRNLQPESPAFFFMTLGNLFYLRFITSNKRLHLFLGGLALSLAWAYSFNFLIGALPFLGCLSFKSLPKDLKKFLKTSAAFLLPYLVVPIVLLFLKEAVSQSSYDPLRLLAVFSPGFWKEHAQAISWYIQGENFTPVYSVLAACGMTLVLLKKEGLVESYIFGWMLSILIYAILLPEDICQNNYAQMPFLIAVCVSSVYAIRSLSEALNRLAKRNLLPAAIVLAALISFPFIKGSLSRMHTTVFLGQDVAGESLREFTKPDERTFLYTHSQGYAVSRYAQRYVGWPADLDDFKKKEETFKVRYVCIYPGEYLDLLRRSHPQIFEYIQGHYHIKEAGLIESPQSLGYLMLEKGEGQDILGALNRLSGKIEARSIYKILGKYIFFYTVRPPGGKGKP